MSLRWQRGRSLVELVIWVGLASLILVAVFVFLTRVFSPPRAQFEQGKIAEDARVEMERLGDFVREATNVDWDEDGMVSADAEWWLQHGDGTEIQFLVRREDGSVQRQRYYLSGTDLVLEASALGTGACWGAPVTEMLARSVRNGSFGVDVFTYFFLDSATQLSTPISDPEQVGRVGVRLVVDADVNQSPTAAVVETEITPRAGIHAYPFNHADPQCSDCLDNDGDGDIDLADAECSSAGDMNEWSNAVQCNDGFDNDGDGGTDFPPGQNPVTDDQCDNAADTNEFL